MTSAAHAKTGACNTPARFKWTGRNSGRAHPFCGILSAMKNSLFLLVAACLACAGCFDNHSRPAEVVTVTSLDELAATNRAEVVRLFLRGAPRAVADADLDGLSETELRQLDLSELGIDKVPGKVWSLKGLTSFWCARNKLEVIPDEVAQLPELTYLNLDGNSIKSIPDSLSGAAKLRWLRLNDNKIGEVPASLGALKDLRRIYLRRNTLTAVPEVVREWPELEDLILDENAITDVPDWIGTDLPHLKSLSLKGCPVTRLPEDISGLRQLTTLNVANCPLPSAEVERIRRELGDKVVITF